MLQAASKGHTRVCELLCTAGAPVDQSDPHVTPLLAAVLLGNVALCEILLTHGASTSTSVPDAVPGSSTSAANCYSGMHALHVAAAVPHDRSSATIPALVGRGGALVNQIAGGSTPLHLAAAKGNIAAVKALLMASADCDIRDKNGATALYHAAANRHLSIVRALLMHKANVSFAKNDGETPLLACIRNGNNEIAAALLASGALLPANLSDTTHTPLSVCCEKGFSTLVSLLISYGANTSSDQGGSLQAPISIARQHGHNEIVSIIERHNSALEGEQGYAYAIKYHSCTGNIEAIRRLLSRAVEDKVALLNHCAEGAYFGRSALQIASMLGIVPVVAMLVELGCDINSVPVKPNKLSCKQLACIGGHHEVLKILLKGRGQGATGPQLGTESGPSLVHLASSQGLRGSQCLSLLLGIKESRSFWVQRYNLEISSSMCFDDADPQELFGDSLDAIDTLSLPLPLPSTGLTAVTPLYAYLTTCLTPDPEIIFTLVEADLPIDLTTCQSLRHSGSWALLVTGRANIQNPSGSSMSADEFGSVRPLLNEDLASAVIARILDKASLPPNKSYAAHLLRAAYFSKATDAAKRAMNRILLLGRFEIKSLGASWLPHTPLSSTTLPQGCLSIDENSVIAYAVDHEVMALYKEVFQWAVKQGNTAAMDTIIPATPNIDDPHESPCLELGLASFAVVHEYMSNGTLPPSSQWQHENEGRLDGQFFPSTMPLFTSADKSTSQIQTAQSILAAFDADQSGTLSESEFLDYCSATYGSERRVVLKLFKSLDECLAERRVRRIAEMLALPPSSASSLFNDAGNAASIGASIDTAAVASTLPYYQALSPFPHLLVLPSGSEHLDITLSVLNMFAQAAVAEPPNSITESWFCSPPTSSAAVPSEFHPLITAIRVSCEELAITDSNSVASLSSDDSDILLLVGQDSKEVDGQAEAGINHPHQHHHHHHHGHHRNSIMGAFTQLVKGVGGGGAAVDGGQKKSMFPTTWGKSTAPASPVVPATSDIIKPSQKKHEHVKKEKDNKHTSSPASEKKNHSEKASSAPITTALPEGWKKKFSDKHNRPFYVSDSGKKTWSLEEVQASSSSPAPKSDIPLKASILDSQMHVHRQHEHPHPHAPHHHHHHHSSSEKDRSQSQDKGTKPVIEATKDKIRHRDKGGESTKEKDRKHHSAEHSKHTIGRSLSPDKKR